MRQKIDTDRGLLVIEYDGALVDAVGAALGDLKSQRFKVLKNAVNATAKQAQAALVDKAQAEYAAKKGRSREPPPSRKGLIQNRRPP